MGNRNTCGDSGQCASIGARRVALDDQEIRPICKQGRNRLGDPAGMATGIGKSRTVQSDPLECGQAVVGDGQFVLPGQQQARRLACRGQGMDDWRKLDRFRTSADDDVDTLTLQSSP